MTVGCFCGINTQTANALASYTNSKNTQNQDVYCVVQKKNYAYLFIAFIFYYRLEQIDAFVMKSEVVTIY